MKQTLGFWLFAIGIVGLGFGLGGAEHAETFVEWLQVVGLTVTAAMLTQLGIWFLVDKQITERY